MKREERVIMSKEIYSWNDDGVFVVEDLRSDLDVLVDVVSGYVRERNWWVVFNDKKKSVSVIMKEMNEKIKEYIKERGIGEYFVESNNWVMDYESNNIMNSDIGYFVIGSEEGKEKFNKMEKVYKEIFEGKEVSEEEFDKSYKELDEWIKNVDVVDLNNYKDIINGCVEWMGNEESGELKRIVES